MDGKVEEKPRVLRVKRKRSAPPEEAIVLEETWRRFDRGKRYKRGEELAKDVERALQLAGRDGKGSEETNRVVRMMYRKVETFEMPHLAHSQSAKDLMEKIEQRQKVRKELRKSTAGSKSETRLENLRKDKVEMERTVRYTQVQSRRTGTDASALDPLQDAFRIYDLLHVDTRAIANLSHGSFEERAEGGPERSPEEVEHGDARATTDDYVYDLYVAEDDDDADHGSAPVVQVANDPEMLYFGPEEHDEFYDSEDSNDENYVGNDYPDEPDSFPSVRRGSMGDGTYSNSDWSRSSEEYEDYL